MGSLGLLIAEMGRKEEIHFFSNRKDMSEMDQLGRLIPLWCLLEVDMRRVETTAKM